MENTKHEITVIEIDTAIESVLKIGEAIEITPASIQWHIPKDTFIKGLEMLKLEASKIKVGRNDISKRKKDRAALNKGRDLIRDLVKGKIDESMSAINELTVFGKQAVGLVVEASKMLDDQIKEIEEVDKANRRKTIELEIARLMTDIELDESYKAKFVFDEKWLNASASLLDASKEAQVQIGSLFNQQEAQKAKYQGRIHLIEKYNEIYNFSFDIAIFPPESCTDDMVLKIYQDNVAKRQADMDRKIAQEKAKLEYEAKQRELRELEQQKQELSKPVIAADIPSYEPVISKHAATISQMSAEQVKNLGDIAFGVAQVAEKIQSQDNNFEEFTIKVRYDKNNVKHVEGVAKIMAWFEKEKTGVKSL